MEDLRTYFGKVLIFASAHHLNILNRLIVNILFMGFKDPQPLLENKHLEYVLRKLKSYL